jgi:hypothetical protein
LLRSFPSFCRSAPFGETYLSSSKDTGRFSGCITFLQQILFT